MLNFVQLNNKGYDEDGFESFLRESVFGANRYNF